MANNGQVGAAYFRFDTNVEEVSQRISRGLGALSSEIAKAEARTNTNAGAFRDGGFERSLTSQINGLRDLSRQLESGRISAAQFGEQFRSLTRTALQGIPAELGRRLAASPESLRNALPIVEIARQQGSLARDALFDELSKIRKSSPAVREALAGAVFQRKEFADEIASLARSPYAIPGDYAAQIAENARLERLAREISRRRVADPFADPEDGPARKIVSPADEELLERLGLRRRFAEDPLLSSIMDTGRKPAGYGSTYVDREREFLRDEAPAARRTADAAQKTNLAMEEAERHAANFARFMSDPNMVRAGTYLFSPGTGLYGRINRGGAELIPDLDLGDQYRAQQAIDREVRRAQGEAERAQREATRQANLEAARRQPFTQAFLSGFTSRGFGAREGAGTLREFATNELSTFGTVARYTALYQSLFAIQGAFTDTAAEALDFRDSLTDLNVAMEDNGPASAGLVGDLQAISRLAGENTGAALDAAARGIRAFGDDYEQAGGQVDDAGVDIARASARIALIAGKDLRDATGDVIAIASAFQLSADQANQVVDAVSAAKDFGGDPKQIAQGLANFATTANEAGFTLGESANALSLVIARTDQSGQAAATRLSRITSILAGTTGRRVIEELNGEGANIDPAASVRDQLVQIATAYQNAAPELQGRIRSALGGTSNLRELIPLLDEGQLANPDGSLGRIFTEAGQQAGRGVEEFRRKTDDLVGLIKKLQGDLSAIQVNLFRVGIFDGIGVALAAIEPGLNVLARLLDLIDRMTDAIPGLQTVLGTLLDIQIGLAIANKIRPGIVAGNVFDLIAPRTGAIDPRTAAKVPAAGGSYVAASEAAKSEVALAGAATKATTALNGLTVSAERAAAANTAEAASETVDLNRLPPPGGGRLGGARGRLAQLAPFAAIAAAIAAGDVFFDSFDKIGQVNETERKNALVRPTDFTDAASILEAADSLRANRAELRESQQGFSLLRPLDSLSSLFAKPRRDAAIEDAREQEEYLRELAKRIDAETELAAQSRQVSVFGDDAARNLEQVALGLSKLKESGAGAVEQANLLARALREGDTRRPGGPQRLPTDDPTAYGATVADALLRGVVAAAEGKNLYVDAGANLLDPNGGRLTEDVSPKALAERVRNGTIQTVDEQGNPITATVEEFVAAYARDWVANAGLKEGEVLSPEDQRAMMDALIATLNLDGIQGEVSAFKRDLRRRALREAGVGQQAGLAPADRRLTAQQAFELINGTEDGEPGIRETLRDYPLSRTPQSDERGRLGILRQYRNTLRDVAEDNPDLEFLAEELALAEAEFSQAAVDRLEKLRRAAQAAVMGNDRAVRLAGRKFFNQEVNRALNNNNVALLTEIFERASQFEVDLVEERIRTALRVARAQLESIRNTFSAIDGSGFSLRGYEHAVEESNADVILTKAQKKLKALLDALLGANVSKDKDDSVYTTGSDAAGYEGDSEKDSLTAAQRAAALAAANTRSDDRLGQARVAIQQARADLAAAEKGTAEYYSALKQLNDAQLDYANTLREVRFTARRADSDVTDTVQQARIDLAEARAKLRADRRAGAPDDVINQDRIDVNTKRARLEQEAFSRRMHDAQIAEQLGDISHAAYIRYLQREHDRLEAIKHRTRQQTEQLQEVDLALKAATEGMQGQFNLGDIKVPTPYEARRAVEAIRGGTNFIGERGANTGAGTTTVNNIKIDGTDIRAVERVITNILGPLGTSTSSNASRKA